MNKPRLPTLTVPVVVGSKVMVSVLVVPPGAVSRAKVAEIAGRVAERLSVIRL
ncbi:hypothetical protein JYQ62_16790 [Nostoc sp. UHCC 0702]|nr:hypothetical protein JYQ62_16790 [Nostoc sp. UHCC 0702]